MTMLENEAVKVLSGSYRALILFGSHARGDARPDSDIDILQVVTRPTASYKSGVWSISCYTEPLLRILASHGNLFVWHLITEARVIAGDPEILVRLSRRFVPRPLENIIEDVRLALPLLDTTDNELEHFRTRRFALARYLLKTFIYARAHLSGCPTYSLDQAAAREGLAEVIPLLRNTATPENAFYNITVVLESVLCSRALNPFGSIEAFVVNVEPISKFASDLGLRLLTDDDVPYESTSTLEALFPEDFE